MNVEVRTVDDLNHRWEGVDVEWDTTVLQITSRNCVTTFPLCNVISFSTSDSDPS